MKSNPNLEMDNNVMVSFVLPAYKHDFLKQAIDSILRQTYRSFELIIVDDCSPYNLYDVIKEYEWEPTYSNISCDGRMWKIGGVQVRFYKNEKNMGRADLVAAWDHAMTYALGSWCVLASDDNVYHPEYLAAMMNLASKYPSCNLFHARVANLDTGGQILSVGTSRAEYKGLIDFLYERGVNRFEQSMPDFMFRLEAYKSIGGFVNFKTAWYSDDATWYLLAKNGVAFCNRVLFFDRSSPQQISSRRDNIYEKIFASEQFKRWLKDFLSSMQPNSDIERVMLNGLFKKIESRVNVQSRHDMFDLSIVEWVKCFTMISGTIGQKLKFLQERFSITFSILRLLRKIHSGLGGV